MLRHCAKINNNSLYKAIYRIILLLFLLFPKYAISQQLQITGYVKDITDTPLVYANIVSIQKNIGTITNNLGHFSIKLDINDSLKISYISCKPRIIPVKSIINDSSIVLELGYKNLDEVIIKSKKASTSTTKLGFYNKDRNSRFILKPGNQIAVLINNPKKEEAFIKSISFQITQKGTCNSKLRVRLLGKLDNTMKPGADLLHENIIIENSNLSKTNTIDISNSKVLLPKNGVFMVVEWLVGETDCNENSYPIITGNLSTPENLVWFNYRDKNWNRPNIKPSYKGNFTTPNFSVDVEYTTN